MLCGGGREWVGRVGWEGVEVGWVEWRWVGRVGMWRCVGGEREELGVGWGGRR